MFKHEYNPNRTGGIAKARIALASSLKYLQSEYQTEVDTFNWYTLENWLESWSTQDGMKGELSIEEVIFVDNIAIDKYQVKLYFRLDTKENFQTYADKYLRNRLLALEVTLENDNVKRLVPMICSYKYNVPQDVGGVNTHELTFTRAKSVDIFGMLVMDDIVKVAVECDSRKAYVVTKEGVKEGYEMGVSKTDNVLSVKDWYLGNMPMMLNGNGRQYIFVRSAAEPEGLYISKPYFINCPYLGAKIEVYSMHDTAVGTLKTYKIYLKNLAGMSLANLEVGIGVNLLSVASWHDIDGFGWETEENNENGLPYIIYQTTETVFTEKFIFIRDKTKHETVSPGWELTIDNIYFAITDVTIEHIGTKLKATVIVDNPNAFVLEYSIDDITYQSSNIFENLLVTHLFYVRLSVNHSVKVSFEKNDAVNTESYFHVPEVTYSPATMLNQVDYTQIPDFDIPKHSDGRYKFMNLLVGPNFRAQATADNVMKKGFTMIDWGVMKVGTERQNPTYEPHTYDINFVSSLASRERTINITLGAELNLNGYGSTGELINSVDYSLYSSSITGNLQGNISKFFDGSKTYTDVGVVFLDIEVAGLNDLSIQDFVNRIIAIYNVIKAGVSTNTLVCLHYQSLPHPHVGLGISESSYTQASDPMWTTPASMTANAVAKNFPSVLVGKRMQDLEYLLGVVEFYPTYEMSKEEGYVMMNLLDEPLKDSSGNDISILTHFDTTNRSFLHFATHLNAILEINKKDIGNRPILLQTSIFNQARGGYWYADGTDEMIIKQRYDEYVYPVPLHIVEAIELNTYFLGCWYYAWMDTNVITPVSRSLGEIHTSSVQRRDFTGMTAIAAGLSRLSAYKGVIDAVEYSVADLLDGSEIYTGMLTQVDYLTVSTFTGIQTVKGTDFQKHKIPVVRCIVNESMGLIAILYYMPYGVELSNEADVYYNNVLQYRVQFEIGINKILVGKLKV